MEFSNKIDNTQNKIEHLLDRYKLYEINNKNKFNDMLKSLDYERFKKMLSAINYNLRIGDDREKGIYDGVMFADSLISPPNDVQEVILEKTFNAIKEMDNDKYKGALAYYVLLKLHLFGDGNGRTARFFYRLLSEDNYDITNYLQEYKHDSDDFKTMDYDFEEKVGIMNHKVVGACVSAQLLYKLLRENKIPNNNLLCKNEIKTWGDGIMQSYNSVYIKPEIKEKLGSDKIRLINISMLDNNSAYSASGLALAVYLNSKNELQKWIEYNEKEISYAPKEMKAVRASKFIFYVGEEEGHNLMDSWTLEDYYELIELRNKLSKDYLECLIDIFKNSESYKIDDDINVADYLVNNNLEIRKER